MCLSRPFNLKTAVEIANWKPRQAEQGFTLSHREREFTPFSPREKGWG